MDDVGDAFDGEVSTSETSETDAHAGQTPPEELARVREKAEEKIGEGGKTGMSGAESGYGATGQGSGLTSTGDSALSDEGLPPAPEKRY